MKNKKVILVLSAVIVFAFVGGMLMPTGLVSGDSHADMNMDEMREHHINLKNTIKGDLMSHGDYACCLNAPCTYCIEKTPGHGEGAACHCLDDVMNGRHPCGECIGEIMEGHGNKFIAPYFATAIAEKVGEQHLPELKQIIFEKYGVPVEDQI